jgi:hypothetical protein
MKNVLVGLCALSGFGVLDSVPAQSLLPPPQIFPSRIAVAEYGLPSGFPCGLRISCSLREPRSSVIRLAGGTPLATAIILAGTAPTNVPLPGLGTLLVAPPLYPVGGYFDDDGVFDVPIDLAQPDLVGLELHLQGWTSEDGAGFDHSAGLRVTYHPTNAQPALTYRGPPVHPVFCRFEGSNANLHELLARFDVPSTGYTVDVRKIERTGQTTRVTIALVYPSAPQIPLPEELRVVADLGADPGTKVELWIEETFENCACVSLASVIETKY